MTVADALRAIAADIEARPSQMVGSGPVHPSENQIADKSAQLQEIANGLRALADTSETRQVRAEEYEALNHGLQKLGFAIPSDLATNVANAIHAAKTS